MRRPGRDADRSGSPRRSSPGCCHQRSSHDFYIDNPEIVYELLHFADEREIIVLSGKDPSESVLMEPAQLGELYDGTYKGEPVYGTAPGEPIAMNVSVLDGEITKTAMVYLP